MGRFDALTQLDKKPVQPTPQPEKFPVVQTTSKPASMQTSKQVNLQTGKQVFIEKYSSYLTHEYKKELKRIAWESDRNEYEVLIEAVEEYLAQHKHPK